MESIHPALEQLDFLVGSWSGTGRGIYPTIEGFEYEETIGFEPGPGKPFLAYRQRTRRVGTGEPLHAEMGYLRSVGPGRIEWVIAQPTGIAEMLTGTVEDRVIRFAAGSVHLTPTATRVERTERHIEVTDGDPPELRYTFSMAAVDQPHQLHLEATLHPFL